MLFVVNSCYALVMFIIFMHLQSFSVAMDAEADLNSSAGMGSFPINEEPDNALSIGRGRTFHKSLPEDDLSSNESIMDLVKNIFASMGKDFGNSFSLIWNQVKNFFGYGEQEPRSLYTKNRLSSPKLYSGCSKKDSAYCAIQNLLQNTADGFGYSRSWYRVLRRYMDVKAEINARKKKGFWSMMVTTDDLNDLSEEEIFAVYFSEAFKKHRGTYFDNQNEIRLVEKCLSFGGTFMIIYAEILNLTINI